MALFNKPDNSQAQAPPYPADPNQQQGYDQNYYQDPNQQYQDQGYDQNQQAPPEGAPPPADPGMNAAEIEEIAEKVVEEKWNSAKKELDQLEDFKDDVTHKLDTMQQQITDLKGHFDSLHKGVLGKITEYDDNLQHVGTEIQSMEKVFSKVLPSLTDSVNKLQRFSGKAPVKKKPVSKE